MWLGWLLARGSERCSRWLSRGWAPVERLLGSYEVTGCLHVRKMNACAPPVGAVSVKAPADRARGGCVSFPTIGAYYAKGILWYSVQLFACSTTLAGSQLRVRIVRVIQHWLR